MAKIKLRSKFDNLELESTGANVEVFIDGQKRNDVTDIVLKISAEGLNTAVVTYLVGELDVELDADIQAVSEEVKETYNQGSEMDL